MAGSSFIQKVFCDISLEKRPDLWQDDKDTEEKNVERICFLAEFDQTLYRSQLDPTKSTTRKNNMLAKALKEKGNKSYGSGDNIEAMNLYNQALCFSSGGSEGEYSIILANRSALWAVLSEHNLVIIDVNLAIECGYPTEMFYKLLERRAKSKLLLCQYNDALEDVSIATEALNGSDLNDEKRKAKANDLNILRKKIETQLQKKDTNGGNLATEIKPVTPTFSKMNEKFPSFSDAVDIKYEEGRGRYAVAARDISVGEVVAIESPYVSLIDKEYSKNHCWNCLICTKCPIPCERCSGVVFCSTNCRKIACQSYHRYECLYTDVLYQAQIGAWLLAYRALVSRPWKYYQDNIQLFLQHDSQSGVTNKMSSDQVYKSDDIFNFNNLVTHDGAGAKQAPELMMQSHVVVFLLRMVRTVGYLETDLELDNKTLSDQEIHLVRILHHFMRATYYNTHEITEVDKCGDGWEDNNIRRIGRVTNSSLALINHSCDPNYRRVSDGLTTFGFACKPIGKGQEISDIYCKPFSGSTLQERHKSLAKYNFQCECPACVSNWSVISELSSSIEGLPPKMYKQPANKIDTQAKRIKRAEDNFYKLRKKTDINALEIVKGIVSVVEEVHKLLKQPHQLIVYWENQLHQALLHAYAAKVTSISSGNSVVTWPLIV